MGAINLVTENRSSPQKWARKRKVLLTEAVGSVGGSVKSPVEIRDGGSAVSRWQEDGWRYPTISGLGEET